jgi:hypothetical protein
MIATDGQGVKRKQSRMRLIIAESIRTAALPNPATQPRSAGEFVD